MVISQEDQVEAFTASAFVEGSPAAAPQMSPRHVPVEVLESLQKVARQLNASIFSVLLSSLAALVARWDGQDEVPFELKMSSEPSDGEGLPHAAPRGTVRLRAELANDPSFVELLSRVSASLYGAGGIDDPTPEMCIITQHEAAQLQV